jgi:hypothetical protein
MLALIVLLVVVVGGLGVVFWNVTRGESNVAPALGTNNPYPDGVGILGPGEEAPSFLPTPIISPAEEFRRDAHLHLAKPHHRARGTPARSWMEEPGAMEAAGLVDVPELPSGAPATETVEDGGAPSRGSTTS